MTDFDPAEFGRSMGVLIREAVEPLKSENAELRKEIEALKAREPDRIETIVEAPPIEVDVAEIVKELLATDGVKHIVGMEVAAYMAENPAPAGKDGAPGRDGDPGQPGKSVTLEDVSLFLDAAIAKHVLELERRATDAITKAIDKIPAPKDGKDGADFSDASIDYDGERTITIKGRGGEIVKRVPIPLDRGYWSPGQSHEKGDVVTHNGVAFIAKRDTTAEPKTENCDDWRILARKGRDGKEVVRTVRPPESVKLRGSDA